MDKDRIAGAARRVTGSIKEAIGKIAGDSKLRVKGAAEKTAGKTQASVGKAKDKVRDSLDK